MNGIMYRRVLTTILYIGGFRVTYDIVIAKPLRGFGGKKRRQCGIFIVFDMWSAYYLSLDRADQVQYQKK